MASESVQPIADLAEGPVLPEIHAWVEAVRFGGHLLPICRCGCPGPFVMSWAEASRIPCGVAMAIREGAERLALCGERQRLPVGAI